MFLRQGNSALLSGRISIDPQIKTGISKNNKAYQLVNASVITGTADDGRPLYTNIYAFGSILSNIKKDDIIFASGFYEEQNYVKDGEQKQAHKVRVEFVAVSPKDTFVKQDTTNNNPNTNTSNPNISKFEPVSDDDLPF